MSGHTVSLDGMTADTFQGCDKGGCDDMQCCVGAVLLTPALTATVWRVSELPGRLGGARPRSRILDPADQPPKLS